MRDEMRENVVAFLLKFYLRALGSTGAPWIGGLVPGG